MSVLIPYKFSKPMKEGKISLEESGIGFEGDGHGHTSYSDAWLSVAESTDEAIEYGLYEKGGIEHGSPVDEDIGHLTTFMDGVEFQEEPYTSVEIYPLKFENLRSTAEENGGVVLSDADREKLEEDLETLKEVETKDLTKMELMDYSTHYRIVIPHGIELEYNIPIETTENEREKKEAVESYEDEIIDFLKEAERNNSGFNYVLLSSHYVNTPYRPRYVKKDQLFEEMSQEEKLEELETYRDKEIEKIESLSSRLGEMSVPEISGELMGPKELEGLEEFVYGQSASINTVINEELEQDEIMEATGESLDIGNVVTAVGAHPTLIERNSELIDALREEEGLGTVTGFMDQLNEFAYGISGISDEIPDETDTAQFVDDRYSKEDVNEFLDFYHKSLIYPRESLRELYEPMIEASESEDNFIFEVNGKGIERQFPSVFWEMLSENTFGSDAHRTGEQKSRVTEFSDRDLPGDLKLVSERWLEQIKSKQD